MPPAGARADLTCVCGADWHPLAFVDMFCMCVIFGMCCITVFFTGNAAWLQLAAVMLERSSACKMFAVPRSEGSVRRRHPLELLLPIASSLRIPLKPSKRQVSASAQKANPIVYTHVYIYIYVHIKRFCFFFLCRGASMRESQICSGG